MREIENHTEDYLVLVPEGRGLMDKYLPNDWLGGVMQALSDRWEGYVDNLNERCALIRNGNLVLSVYPLLHNT